MEKIKKNCLNCKHFQSYFEMYDSNDEEEPKDLGRCQHPDDDDTNETHWNTAGSNAEKGCKDWGGRVNGRRNKNNN